MPDLRSMHAVTPIAKISVSYTKLHTLTFVAIQLQVAAL